MLPYNDNRFGDVFIMKKIVFVEGKLGRFCYCGDCAYRSNGDYDAGECKNPDSPYYGRWRPEYESCYEA